MSYKAMYKGKPLGGGSSAPAGSNIPSGGIIMWSGSEAPEGWAICDGQNGTPDLRGRFVLGMTTETDEDGNTAHPVGDTGGAEEVTLTVEQMPMHRHTVKYFNVGQYETTGLSASNNVYTTQSTANTNFVGGDQPHENMPPYYTLAYIMKL